MAIPIEDGPGQAIAMPAIHHPWFISYAGGRAKETNLEKA